MYEHRAGLCHHHISAMDRLSHSNYSASFLYKCSLALLAIPTSTHTVNRRPFHKFATTISLLYKRTATRMQSRVHDETSVLRGMRLSSRQASQMWDASPDQLLSRRARTDYLALRAAAEGGDGGGGGGLGVGKVGALLRVARRSRGVRVQMLRDGSMAECWRDAHMSAKWLTLQVDLLQRLVAMHEQQTDHADEQVDVDVRRG